jgi:large repetitive protein
MSCASCHNDGGHDGRTWDFTGFGEGLRNTIALRGRAGTAAARAACTGAQLRRGAGLRRPDPQLRAGTGPDDDAQFNTGTRSQPLGDAKAGVSADLDALAAYVNSLTFEATPHRRRRQLTPPPPPAARSLPRCAQPATAAPPSPTAPGTLRNIGTIKPSAAAPGRRAHRHRPAPRCATPGPRRPTCTTARPPRWTPA